MAAHSDALDLPLPKDFTHHLSRVTKRRGASEIKRFYKYFSIPGIGNLAGGLPNNHYFPFDTLEARAAHPNRFKSSLHPCHEGLTHQLKRTNIEDDANPAESHVVVPHDSKEASVLRKIDLATALQYGTAQGYPPLYAFVREFAQTKLHPNVPYRGGPEVILTCGNTDGFAKAIECLSNVWDPERDWIREREGLLCEEFAYMGAIQTAKPRGLNIVPVAVDDEGMLAYGKGGLLNVMENWDKNQGRRPHLMYTVTMGQNPTSGVLSVQRRKEIYAICQKYDIMIIEDDPYFFIQFPSAMELSVKHRGRPISTNYPTESNFNYQTSTTGGRSSGYPFLDSLVPSYLSVDIDGRVVRLDTFSKTVAPGCRLGWITAQPGIVERIQRITECTTQQPSGFVQSLIAELLIGPDQADLAKAATRSSDAVVGWKFDGWVRWLEGLRANYERRMQTMAQIMEEGKFAVTNRRRNSSSSSQDLVSTGDEFEVISKVQLYDFAFPMGGMFLWLRCHYESHPLCDKVDHERLAQAHWVFQTTEPYRVLSAPGTIFSPTEKIRKERGWQYFRLCFAAVDDDQVAKISRDFVDATVDFWEIEDPKKIDELLEDLEGESIHERHARLTADVLPGAIMC